MLVRSFTFTPPQRRELANSLAAAGIADAAIGDLETAAETFQILLASPGPTSETAAKLGRLGKMSDRFIGCATGLDNDGRDMIAQTLARRGYSSMFLANLTEGHRILRQVLDLLDRERGRRFARPGRPRESARDWLEDEVGEILKRHRRPSRRRVLEALARGGIAVSARSRALPVRPCATVILRALRQPVPAKWRVVRKVKNPPRK